MPEGTPEVRISDRADETSRQLLSDLGKLAHDNPSEVQAAIDIYALDPETVSTVVDYISDNPESLPILRIVAKAMDAEADYLIDIPEKLMEDLKQDAQFGVLQLEKQRANSPEEKRSAMAKIRGFWLRKGVEHIPAA